MMRPQPFFFMPGTAARIPWKAEDRLIAMIWSHFSIGNSSIGETNWMPALLTRMSTEPNVFSPSAIIPAISAGLVMSAGEYIPFPPKSDSVFARSFSMSSGEPKPLMTTLAPAPAKARAYASPMPLVDPVTTAFLPDRLPMLVAPFWRGRGDVPREIVGHHGLAGLRPLEPVLVAHRRMDVAHAGFPVLDHGNMREVVILGRGFVVLAAVDQVHHGDGAFTRRLVEDLDRRIVLQIIRQLVDQRAQRLAGVVHLLVLVGVHPGAAGEADVLLALRGLEQRGRQVAAGAEEIDLEDQEVTIELSIQHVIERRIGSDAAVPIMLALDHDGRKSGRQRAGSHDVLGTDLLAELLELVIVEIFEVPRGDPDRSDRQARLEIIDAVEIDQTLQRLLQRRGVVIAFRLRTARRPERRRRNPRREEARYAEGRDQRSAGGVEQLAAVIALADWLPRHRRRDHLPEFL